MFLVDFNVLTKLDFKALARDTEDRIIKPIYGFELRAELIQNRNTRTFVENNKAHDRSVYNINV